MYAYCFSSGLNTESTLTAIRKKRLRDNSGVPVRLFLEHGGSHVLLCAYPVFQGEKMETLFKNLHLSRISLLLLILLTYSVALVRKRIIPTAACRRS
jgi:hypothetical protein